MPGQIRMPEAVEQRGASNTSLLFAYSASFPSSYGQERHRGRVATSDWHYLFKGTCIQGGENYAAWSGNVKEFVGIYDTNVPPQRTLACSPHAAAGTDPKSWSDFGENLRRFGTPPSSIQWGEL